MMFLGHNNLASFVSWSTILAVLLLPAAVFGQQHQDVDVASQIEALAASFEGAFLPRSKVNWLASLSGADGAKGLQTHDAIADMLKEHDNEIRVDDTNAGADMKIGPMTAETLGDIRKGLGVVLEHWDDVYGAFCSSIANRGGPSRNRDLQSVPAAGEKIIVNLAAIGPGIGQGQVPGTNPTSSSEDILISAIFGVLGAIFGEDSDILVLAFTVIPVLLVLFSPEGEASRQAEMSVMHDVAMTPMKNVIVGAMEGTNMTMTMDSPEVNNIADALLGEAENLLNKLITEFKKLTSSDGRRLQAGLNPVAILLGALDEFLLFLPEAIEGLLSENELTILCLVYDSLSYTATSMFRILIQILDELWRVQFLGEMPRPNDILQIDSYSYFASLPSRFRLCGVEIILSGSGGSINQEEFAICIASSFLPFVPILFRAYFNSIPKGTLPSLPAGNLDFAATILGLRGAPTLEAGRAVMSLDYLLEENPYDSNNVVNIFGFTNDQPIPNFINFLRLTFKMPSNLLRPAFKDCSLTRITSWINRLLLSVSPPALKFVRMTATANATSPTSMTEAVGVRRLVEARRAARAR